MNDLVLTIIAVQTAALLAVVYGIFSGQIKGAQGKPGEPGKPGERGEKGERGERGERGDRGERGEPSEQEVIGDRRQQGDLSLGTIAAEASTAPAPAQDPAIWEVLEKQQNQWVRTSRVREGTQAHMEARADPNLALRRNGTTDIIEGVW